MENIKKQKQWYNENMPRKKTLTLIIFLAVFGLGFFSVEAISAFAADELTVSNITRLSPPAYEMRNSWKGTGRPINANKTKILLNEYIAYNNGRGVVVADIADLKNAIHTDPNVWLSNYMSVTRPLNNSFLSYDCTFMYDVRDVGCINRWGSQTVQWSRISGEENIIYALYDSKRELVKINVETGVTSVVGTYPSGLTYPQLLGWYEPSSVIINGNGNSYGSGYLMDVISGATTYFSYPKKFDDERSTVEAKKWDYQSIHSARSPNKNLIVHYSGTAAKDGVFNNDCTYIPIPCDNPASYPYPADWLHGFGHNITHVNWVASNDWYIGGTAGNPYRPYGSDGKINTGDEAPYITTHEIYQIFFSLDKVTGQVTFDQKLLISQESAGLWYNGSDDLNYWALPSPTMSIDGRMIVYQSTDGKYSLEDYQSRSATPWGTIGIFLADLAPANDNPADVDGSGGVNIKDIQACIKVITGSDMTYENQCKVLADPVGNTNIKDIQVIIRAIIN